MVPIIPVFVWNNWEVSFGIHRTGLPSWSFLPKRIFIPGVSNSSCPSSISVALSSTESWCSSSSFLSSVVFSAPPSGLSISSCSSSFPTDNFDKSPVKDSTAHCSSNIISGSFPLEISAKISITSFKISPNSSFSGISIKLIESSLKDVRLSTKAFLKDSTAPFPNSSWISSDISYCSFRIASRKSLRIISQFWESSTWYTCIFLQLVTNICIKKLRFTLYRIVSIISPPGLNALWSPFAVAEACSNAFFITLLSLIPVLTSVGYK